MSAALLGAGPPDVRPGDLAAAINLFQQQRLSECKSLCRRILTGQPHDADAVHLLGLVLRQQGNDARAEELLRSSLALAPGRAQFHANLGNLLKQLGRRVEARRSFEQALRCEADFVPARLALARLLNADGQPALAEEHCRAVVASEAGHVAAHIELAHALRAQMRLAEAESVYRSVLAFAPHDARAHHDLGAMLSQLERAEEACAALDRAHGLGVRGFELEFNRGRVLLQLSRLEEAECCFARAVALRPQDIQAQLNLARLRFMRGDAHFAREIVAAAHRAPAGSRAQWLLGDVLRRTGDLAAAEALVVDLIARGGSTPALRSALASILHEAGRLPEARSHALAAVAALPGDPTIVENLVAVLLSLGSADEALAHIRAQRQRWAADQRWLAYEATAARLCGGPEHRDLFDYERLVRTYEVEPPAGWRSIDDLNAALVAVLGMRHCCQEHPFDQSLRNGTQTTRSLLTEPDGAVRAILAAFERPLAAYRRALGTDPAHPFRARNRGESRFAGCWSVRLRQGGFHVNHIHPQGWISSAYYVALPGEVADADRRSGWIQFGEPRLPVPGATPEHFVQPRAGLLVLFPSYLWHGTTPTVGPQPRLSIAFDVVPA